MDTRSRLPVARVYCSSYSQASGPDSVNINSVHKFCIGGCIKRRLHIDSLSSTNPPKTQSSASSQEKKMKFTLSSITTAALALVASAAPTEIAQEVSTELPARFAMYLVTAEPRANGLRVGYVNSEFISPSIGLTLQIRRFN